MNTHTLMAPLLGLGFAASAMAADAPTTKTPSKDEIDLLRRVLQEQRANPDKIIRVPSATNAAPAATPKTPAATTTPATATARPPTTSAAPAPAVQAVETKPAPAPAKTQAPTSNIPTNFPTWTELEDAYLNRKITSRRFEEALKLLDRQKQITNERQDAVTKMLMEKGIQPVAPPANAAEQKKIADVESKADELLRLKAQREQQPAAATPPTVPLTKRQRLDDLLRQMIDGKITDAEYKEKREKVIAEPD